MVAKQHRLTGEGGRSDDWLTTLGEVLGNESRFNWVLPLLADG